VVQNLAGALTTALRICGRYIESITCVEIKILTTDKQPTSAFAATEHSP
jgi:hypothetical protein